MEVDDAARGREAALKVRRSKKQERQAEVRELEERSVPRMQMRAELERLGFKVSQGTLWNDLQELGYGQRRPRKHPKPEPRRCEECGEIFTPKDASQDARGYGKLCSDRCRRRRGGGRATERHRRADKELAHLNTDGYLIMRQAAAEVGVAESTMHRYAELGYFETVGQRSVEGERWTLVERDELGRFKAEEWPEIRREHGELRWQDDQRGWPRMPSTWSGERRRLWSRRARAPHVGKLGGQQPSYTDEQARLTHKLKAKYPKLGRATIAQMVSEATGKPTTEKQVRAILAKPRS
jgi:hypothetical protein